MPSWGTSFCADDDDESLADGGDDFFTREVAAAALDEVEVGINFVGTVDGDVEGVGLVEGGEGDVEVASDAFGLDAGGDPQDGEGFGVDAFGGQAQDEGEGGFAGAEAEAQVYGFALQSGGVATVDSKPGEGTSVSLYLPAHNREATRTVPDDRREATASSKGTVLVVEDDADVAEVATSVLKNAGYAVRLVEHARGALAALASATPINLVFSDILLPHGMNGITLAQEVQTLYPKIPVLLTTGYTEARADPKASGLTILQKPYSSANMLTVIDQVLREHVKLSAPTV